MGAVSLAGLAAIAGAWAPATARAPQPAPAPPPVHLPAPVTITAGLNRFRLARDGRVSRLRANPVPSPHGVTWFPATGTWYELRHGHLVVGRYHRRLWRSRGKFPKRFGVDVINAQGSNIAFAYGIGAGQQLYLARTRSPERRIAAGEFPVGWTRGGFFTYRFRGHELRLWSDAGALRETVVRRPLEYGYDQSSQSLYFVTGGRLMRARGAVTGPVVSLARLGLRAGRSLMMQPIGDGLIELLEGNRLIILGADGGVVAQTRLAGRNESITSQIAVAPDDRTVAFAAATGAAGVVQTVYLLRAGEHQATAVLREHVRFAPCVFGTNVAWHDGWLLFSGGEGSLALIDTTGQHRTIELTQVARRLPGVDGGFGAEWGTQA